MRLTNRHIPHGFRQQRGLSIVELLVGSAIGLFVVAGATTLFANYLVENTQVVLETRLNQDLRATADLIARDFRRAGYWASAEQGVWYRGTTNVLSNNFSSITPTASSGSSGTYSYSKNTDNVLDSDEQFGFLLNGTVIEARTTSTSVEQLSDPRTVEITAFSITPTAKTIDLRPYCTTCTPALCPTLSPAQTIRTVDISLTGRIPGTTISRTIRESIRVRNDAIVGSCPV